MSEWPSFVGGEARGPGHIFSGFTIEQEGDNLGYVFFAKYRHTISSLISGQKRCDSCSIDSEVK